VDVRYAVVPGIFRRICARAEEAWQAQGENAPRYLLIIDEINRANIAKVFGELITLVEDDKRLGAPNHVRVTLPYSGEVFGVPPNLYIVATMNTADRSIALLDVALRRRFAFVEVMPDPSLLHAAGGVDVAALLSRLNQRLSVLLDRNYQIGHSFFLDVHSLPGLRFAWYYRIVPLLQEYFASDQERLRAVLGKDFVVDMKPATSLFDVGVDWMDGGTSQIEINRFEDDNAGFIAALRHLSGTTA
jgi:5-methylcytosine-specific restriction protein B